MVAGNRPSSLGLPPGQPLDHRHGGRLSSTTGELSIHGSGDDYLVEGNGTIRSLPTMAVGMSAVLRILGSPTFVNSSKLICPGNVNYVGAAGDFVRVLSAGDGIWRIYVLPALPGTIQGPQGRLTLTSGTSVTVADVASATTIYWTPSGGTLFPLWNGSKIVMRDCGGELSHALDSNNAHAFYHASGNNWDLWLFDDSGTLRLGTGPAWSGGGGSANARGTGALSTELDFSKSGIATNKNSMSVRWGTGANDFSTVAVNCGTYVGSFRTIADGQTCDTKSRRFLFNGYVREQRPLRAIDVTSPGFYAYSTATMRQANANALNQVEVLCGLSGAAIDLTLAHGGFASAVSTVNIGIGINSTTTSSSATPVMSMLNGTNTPLYSFLKDSMGLGYNTYVWLEQGAGSNTQTWVPGAGGLTGTVMM